VRNQAERGFAFPFQAWLDGPWRERFVDVTRRATVPLKMWYQGWALLALEQWLDRVGEMTAGTPRTSQCSVVSGIDDDV